MATRCEWAESAGDLYIAYHDEEWGVPEHNDIKLFEALVLDGFQAGLSWAIILRKREAFRKAFDNFDPEKIASYGEDKIRALMHNEAIVRNQLKIRAAITGARLFQEITEEFGSFDQYIWQFVGGNPIVNKRKSMRDIPVSTGESDAMSKDLKKRGFKFVGTTICYAYMQAVGMVNDHTINCFRYRELS